MNNVLVGFSSRHCIVPARIFMILLGGFSVVWAWIVLPIVLPQPSLERTARLIVDGHPINIEKLIQQLSTVETIEQSRYCYPSAARNAALLRLRLVEEAISLGNRNLLNSQMSLLGNSIRSSLSCSPADSFLWLVLFWQESASNGFRFEYFKYLRMSYRFGRNEGWIALKRNRMVFAMFEQLPSDLAEDAIGEFVALLHMGLYPQVVEIFTGPAWRVRDLILPHLTSVSQRDLEEFANQLYAQGYDVDLPGINPQERRPWH